MSRTAGFCVYVVADQVGVDIWKIVCPKRKGVEAITRASNVGVAVENVCEICPKKPQSSFLGPEPWTDPASGRDYLIHPDGRCEPLRGRW